LVIEQPKWDFGKVYAGKQVEHVFELKNTGDAALVIEQVRNSCGPCSASMLTDKTIAPGKIGRLKVAYNAKLGRIGKVSTFVTIHSNDPNNPFQRVQISGTVLSTKNAPALSVSPSPADVGVIWPDRRRTVTIEIRNVGKKPLHIKEVTASTALEPTLKVRELQPGAKAFLSVRVNPARLEGLIQEWVKIHSNDPTHPETLIPVYGYATKERPQGIANGLVLSLSGDPLRMPGTGKSLFGTWVVQNQLPVSLRIISSPKGGEAKTDLKDSEIRPGERVKFRVIPAGGSKARQVIRLEIEIPILVDAPSRDN